MKERSNKDQEKFQIQSYKNFFSSIGSKPAFGNIQMLRYHFRGGGDPVINDAEFAWRLNAPTKYF